ncbi:hypothetical protein [Pseudomonas sp. FP1740]|uniref:hypothetical protein n=1 Tax=Pseudomonas sp. FP1740 TaxID=2954078 RepID=UPI0027348FF2|nr:hypothetical protein [Pseudomonas sp. FP1740]WLG43152.1 hypothetical protein PSH69_19990 [Pseudomonas sp. FP1740]
MTIFVERLADTLRKLAPTHSPSHDTLINRWVREEGDTRASRLFARRRVNSPRQYSVHDDPIHSPLRFMSQGDFPMGRVAVAGTRTALRPLKTLDTQDRESTHGYAAGFRVPAVN